MIAEVERPGRPRRLNLQRKERAGNVHPMSTLAEIEAAVEALPRGEQELLCAHLAARLKGQSSASGKARLAALGALQDRLALDSGKSEEWMTAVREARR